MEVHDIIGTLGAFLILGTYFLLQVGRLRAEELRYSLLNAAGAALILFSLFFAFNLSAAVVEGFWLLISVGGIAKWARSR